MEIYRVPTEIELPTGLIIPRAVEVDLRPNGAFALLHSRHSYELRFVMSTEVRPGINVASLYLVEEDLMKGGLDQNRIAGDIYVLSMGTVINGFTILNADKHFPTFDLERLRNYNPVRGGVCHDHN